MPSTKVKALYWVLVILLSAGLFYKQLNDGIRVETNILKLLPETEVDPFAEKAFAQFSDNNFKQIIIGLKSSSNKDLEPMAASLVDQLQQTQLMERFNTQISEDEQEAIAELIFNHRFHLLNTTDRDLMLSEGAEPFIEHSLQMIYSPLSGQLLPLIAQDPLLLSYRYLQQAFTNSSSSDSSTQVVGDFLKVIDSGQQILILSARLKESPFDTKTQEQITGLLDNFSEQNPEVELLTTGALFYAQYAAASAKSEISTIGLGSLIGVIILLIVAFRSTAPLIMTMTSLATGIFIGFTAVHLIFGSIHVLTLVFGASLVGVAVDYAFHYFSSAVHHRRPLPHIFIAILMGLVSSIIGYVALFMAPFPGLQQMAIFCIAGLIGAFLTVTLLFDVFHYKVSTPGPFITLLKHHQSFSRKLAHPTLLIMLLGLPVFAGYLILNTDRSNDNIRQLQAAPQQLVDQEAELTRIISAPATNQFFLVRAESNEQLLQTLSKYNDELDELVSRKVIDQYSHLAQWVPSRAQQQSDYQLIGQQFTESKLISLFDTGLLDASSYQTLLDNYRASESDYLSLSDWLTSPIGQRLSYLWLGKIEGDSAAIISISNIKDLAALEQLAQTHNDLYFINKVDKVSELFSSYRQLATLMLILACLLIFALLLVKYKIKIAYHVMFAPIIAASVAIIVTTIVAGSFNLFSTLALFLVVGIGIDYGLFYAEAQARSIYIHLAVTLSATTTFLSFGLLSLSETPAIHAFGLTMLTGILTVFLLSPIVGNRLYRIKGLDNG